MKEDTTHQAVETTSMMLLKKRSGGTNSTELLTPETRRITKTRGMFLLKEGMTSLQPIRSIVLQNGPQRKTPYDVIIITHSLMSCTHYLVVQDDQ